jgi:hypothetical protein
MKAVAVKLDFHSHGGTAKAWIDPKNRVIALEDMMHFEWLRRNAPFIRKAYKGATDMPDFGPHDEVAARLWALRAGFTRVNYKKASGTITFETNKAFWNGPRQDAVGALVADNIGDIDVAAINVLNDDGSFFKSGAHDVAGIEDVAAKFQAIPLDRTPVNAMTAEALRRGIWRRAKEGTRSSP